MASQISSVHFEAYRTREVAYLLHCKESRELRRPGTLMGMFASAAAVQPWPPYCEKAASQELQPFLLPSGEILHYGGRLVSGDFVRSFILVSTYRYILKASGLESM